MKPETISKVMEVLKSRRKGKGEPGMEPEMRAEQDLEDTSDEAFVDEVVTPEACPEGTDRDEHDGECKSMEDRTLEDMDREYEEEEEKKKKRKMPDLFEKELAVTVKMGGDK